MGTSPGQPRTSLLGNRGEVLYRLPNGEWVWCSLLSLDPFRGRRMSAAQAVEWLDRNGYDPPADLLHLPEADCLNYAPATPPSPPAVPETPGGRQEPPPPEEPDSVTERYVTLDHMAAMVSRSKRTLEKLKTRRKNPLPGPDVEGGGGKPHEWKWRSIRPWLEQEFGRKLPEQFPASRFRDARADRN
jgi:hypothetical protein